MAFWQSEYIREGASMTVAQTYILDLPEFGLLGSLLLRIEGTDVSGYGQSGGAWRVVDEISKVEIIANGATVLKSLTGKQVQALSALDQCVMDPSNWRNYASNTQMCYMLINFGRWFKDPEFGLDLSRFSNVQLKITNTADGTTDFSALTVSVQGIYLRDSGAGAFGGLMRTEEWQAWTTVSNEVKYLNLPTELILRRILLQAIPAVDGTTKVATANMANLMYDVDLSFDTGKIRVFKGGIDDLMRQNLYENYAPFLIAAQPYMNADRGIDVSLGYVLGAVGGAGSKDDGAAATIPTLEDALTSHTIKAETYEGDHPIQVLASGMAPYCVAQFRFDYDPNPATWLNPDQRKTVKLDITTRSGAAYASGRNAVILDRLFIP